MALSTDYVLGFSSSTKYLSLFLIYIIELSTSCYKSGTQSQRNTHAFEGEGQS